MWHNFNFPLNYRIFLRFPLRLTTCLCARCSVHQHDYVLFLFFRRKMYFCYLIRRTWHLSHYVLIAIYNGYRYRHSHPMLMIPSMRGINSTEWWRAKSKKKIANISTQQIEKMTWKYHLHNARRSQRLKLCAILSLLDCDGGALVQMHTQFSLFE